MTVLDVVNKLNMKVLTGDVGLDREVSGVYIGDLLSWVISHAKENNLWITVLTNLNTVAVAILSDVSCIVIPEGIPVEKTTVDKAIKEGVSILSSDLTSYEISIKLNEIGI